MAWPSKRRHWGHCQQSFMRRRNVKLEKPLTVFVKPPYFMAKYYMHETPSDDRVTITKTIREKLNSEARRTGLGSGVLLKQNLGRVPDGLTVGLIESWKRGKTRTANPCYLNWTLRAYATCNVLVPLTREMITTIECEKKRTGISIDTLLSSPNNTPPNNLRKHNVSSWLYNGMKTVSKEEYNWVISTLKSLPNSKTFKLTHDDLAKLRYHIKRTGCGSRKILRGVLKEIPDGLSSGHISAWNTGAVKSANIEHWKWVIHRYENYKPDPNIIDLTTERITALKSEATRTGTTASRLIKNTTKEIPEGMKALSVDNWLRGAQKQIVKSHYDFIMSEFESLSDDAFKIQLTKANISLLKREMKKTGLVASQILRIAPKPLPNGLNERQISAWLCERVKTAKRDQWDYVIETLASVKKSQRRR